MHWIILFGGIVLAMVGYGVGYEHGTREQFHRDCDYTERYGRLPIHSNPTPMTAKERRARRAHPSRGIATVDAALLGLTVAAVIILGSMVFGGPS